MITMKMNFNQSFKVIDNQTENSKLINNLIKQVLTNWRQFVKFNLEF